MITTEIVAALKKAIEILENEKPKKERKPTKQERINYYQKLYR